MEAKHFFYLVGIKNIVSFDMQCRAMGYRSYQKLELCISQREDILC